MSIEQTAQNHALQNQGMQIDPKWSDAEKEKYTGAYMAARKQAEQTGH